MEMRPEIPKRAVPVPTEELGVTSPIGEKIPSGAASSTLCFKRCLGEKLIDQETRAEPLQSCFLKDPGAFLERIDSFAESPEMDRELLSRDLNPPLTEPADHGGRKPRWLISGWGLRQAGTWKKLFDRVG